MSEKIGAGLAIAAILAIIVALVAFPPAGILVLAAVGWHFLKVHFENERESKARIEAEWERRDGD